MALGSGICLQLDLRGISGVCCAGGTRERATSLAEGAQRLAHLWRVESTVFACNALWLGCIVYFGAWAEAENEAKTFLWGAIFRAD